MRDGWQSVRWSDVCELKYGKAVPKQCDCLQHEVPVLGTSGVFGWTCKPLSTGPRVIVGRKGTLGVQLAKTDFWTVDTAFWLDESEMLDPIWAFYRLKQVDFKNENSGSAVPSLTREHFYSMELDLPPLQEQRRIASALGALDDLIEVNRKLMADAAALLSSLFARLIATSVLTDMPFFEAFDVDFGGAFKGEKFSSNGVGMPLLRIRDLKTQKSDTWTTERISGDVVITAGDVLIGMDAEFRPTYWLGPDSLLNQRVCRIRPKVGSLAFAREALVKPMAFIEGHKTGTTVSHLNKADLAETRIAMPDRQSLSEFDAAADPLRLMIVGLHRENLDLAAARDELLPLLMSGRVRVGDVAA